MCVSDVLDIINFKNCRSWLFFNKYVLEHTFSVSWVREAVLRNFMYTYLAKICALDFLEQQCDMIFAFHTQRSPSNGLEYYSF